MVKLLPKHNTDHSPLQAAHDGLHRRRRRGRRDRLRDQFVRGLPELARRRELAHRCRRKPAVPGRPIHRHVQARERSSRVSSSGKCVSTTAGWTRVRTGRSEQRGASRFRAHGRKCRCASGASAEVATRARRHELEARLQGHRRSRELLKKFTVDGIALVIANYGSGFRAIPPMCPHMEEPLEESGVIADCTLTCTKHLWSWDLSSLDNAGRDRDGRSRPTRSSRKTTTSSHSSTRSSSTSSRTRTTWTDDDFFKQGLTPRPGPCNDSRPSMKITVETNSGVFDFDCRRPTSSFYAGLARGLTLPYECATGTCGTCRGADHAGRRRCRLGARRRDSPGSSATRATS